MNLRQTDRAYEAFFTNSSDAAFVLDSSCIFEKMNPAATVLLGYEPEELLGQPLLKILPPEIEAVHDRIVSSYLKGVETSGVLGKTRRFEVVDSSGEILPVELKAFELDAQDSVVRFGAVMVDLRARLRLEAERDASMARLANLAHTDELTLLPNRRAFLDALERANASVRRDGQVACVAILDIDHFKRINDTLGHAAGDAVLREIALVIKRQLRDCDLVGRIGGEEFGILLSNSAPGNAGAAADRIRESVARATFDTGETGPVQLTVSIGVSPLAGTLPADIAMKCADKALYVAKHEGRNRVELGLLSVPDNDSALVSTDDVGNFRRSLP